MPRNGTTMREEPRIKQRNRLLTILWAHASFVPGVGTGAFSGCLLQPGLARFLGSLAARCRGGHALLFGGGLRRSFWPLAAGYSQGHILQFARNSKRFFRAPDCSLPPGTCSTVPRRLAAVFWVPGCWGVQPGTYSTVCWRFAAVSRVPGCALQPCDGTWANRRLALGNPRSFLGYRRPNNGSLFSPFLPGIIALSLIVLLGLPPYY